MDELCGQDKRVDWSNSLACRRFDFRCFHSIDLISGSTKANKPKGSSTKPLGIFHLPDSSSFGPSTRKPDRVQQA